MTGIALGLAIMSKGPVAVVLTVLPVVVFATWRRWSESNGGKIKRGQPPIYFLNRGLSPFYFPTRRSLVPYVLATGLTLIVGLSWYCFAAMRTTGAGHLWFVEIFRTDPAERGATPWFNYVKLIPMLAPWSIFLVVGIGLAIRRWWSLSVQSRITESRSSRTRWTNRAGIDVCDRAADHHEPLSGSQDQIPVAAGWSSAVLAAYGLRVCVERAQSNLASRLFVRGHWGFVLVAACAFPIAIASGRVWELRPANLALITPPLITQQSIALWIILSTAMTTIGWWISSDSPLATAFCTATLFLILLPSVMHFYSETADAKSEMKPLAQLIWDRQPDVRVYILRPSVTKKVPPADLAIYLDRSPVEIRDVLRIPPSPAPQVFVCFSPSGQSHPKPPRGWKILGKTPRGKDWWVAFIRAGKPGK